MAYSNDMVLALPPPLKGTAEGGRGGKTRADMAKQQHKKQQRLHPKSQPFDPDDLRRRLHVVIAEQEAQKEKRQRERVDALPAKKAQVQRDRDAQHLYIEHLAATSATRALSEMAVRAGRPVTMPKPKSKPSLQDKLRLKSSKIATSDIEDTSAGTGTGASYRHVPEEAAAQFSRTATSERMREKSLVHSLSKAALRFYVDGVSSAERVAIESSITPGKQRNLLQRARSQRDRHHGRNQFQGARVSGDDGRRSSKYWPGGISEAAILEEDGISALADLHLHAHNQNPGDDGDVHSSDETLVDAVTANQHRIDWTQSDEMLPHEKKGMRLPPLLRKTSSILTLKGKLGHSRKNSSDKDNNKLKIMTIREEEEEEAADDEGSTPMSPKSGSSGRPTPRQTCRIPEHSLGLGPPEGGEDDSNVGGCSISAPVSSPQGGEYCKYCKYTMEASSISTKVAVRENTAIIAVVLSTITTCRP
ncbi:hypothetical protein HD806DRAFT_519810 [Xylariaceae sp. AK1471]|nr:hypothetical protein HD806DRAFT_519810 [Xylariaceae sp. AK1471]